MRIKFLFCIIILSTTLIPVNSAGIEVSVTVEKIVDLLDTYAIYVDGQFKGWPFRINASYESDDRLYVGYSAGMAGIGSFLIDAYNAGFSQASPLIDKIISYFTDNYVVSLVDGIYWSRIANEENLGWLGQRYGTTGIFKFLSLAAREYNSSLDLTWLIEEAYSWMINQVGDNGWPINPSGYITTGWEYGVAGMIDGILDIYELSGNSTYLEKAEEMADWLINTGTYNGSKLSIPWTPVGEGTEFENYDATGRGAGMAGAIDILLRIYNLDSKSIYRDAAINIGEQLVYMDHGGFWERGSVSYITQLYSDNTGLVGMMVGSAGIALSLLDLYEISDNNDFLITAAKAERFIESFVDNYEVGLGLDKTASAFTGYAKGSAGIASYYLELYTRIGSARFLIAANTILTHLSDEILNNGLVRVDERESPSILGYSFNLDEGLAGMGRVFLQLLDAVAGDDLNGYPTAYESVQASFEYPSTSEPAGFYNYWFFAAFIMIIVISKIFRKRVTDNLLSFL